MKYNLWKRIFIFLCIIILISATTSTAIAGNNDKKDDIKVTTKEVIVKYKDNATKVENKIKDKHNKNKVKRYKKVSNKNIYVLELEEDEIDTLRNDADVEWVEEDSAIKFLSEVNLAEPSQTYDNHNEIELDNQSVNNANDENQGTCLICGREIDAQEECLDVTRLVCNECINEMNEKSDSHENNNNEQSGEEQEQLDENIQGDLEFEQGICLTCGRKIDDQEECIDITRLICNECIHEMYNDLFIEEDSEGEKEQEELTEIDDISDIFKAANFTPGLMELLTTGNESIYNSVGDELTWNLLRTNANILHDNNIKGNGIKVAVFDTGIDLNNTELNVAGGVSFVNGITSYDDDNGHGTAMAGVLAAQLNGNSIVGIAPGVELYSVKVLDKDGAGRYSNIIQGIEWAIENNIDIITLSLGGTQYSKILSEAIDMAVANNILILAAAGNGGTSQILYPAAYPQVICVGATDSNNNVASFSNYGFQLDIVAPGANVISTGLNNTKVTVDGTSPATQHVAGVAALLWGSNPNLTNGHIKYLLYNNAHELGQYNTYGHGLVDAEVAFMSLLQGDYSIFVPDAGEGTFVEGLVDAGWDGVVYGQACSHAYTSTTVSAKCTSDGYYRIYCTKCGYVSSNTTYPRLGHNTSTSTTAPTCTTDGSTRVTCSRCSYGLTTVLTKLGHSTTIVTVAAKCETDGYSQPKCTRGGCSYVGSKTTIPKLGHALSYATTAPKCTEDGRTVSTCSRCSYVNNVPIPKLGHNNTTDTVAATCTADGYTQPRCIRSGCGTLGTKTITPKIPHLPSTTTTPNTCYSSGSIRTVCTRCNLVLSIQSIPIRTHSYSYTSSTNATCTANGSILYTCSYSGCGGTTTETTSPLGHNYTSSTSATHSSSGHYWSTYCTRCGTTSNSGYTTLSTCLSCTTPPSISFNNINGNTVLSEVNTAFYPQIKVFDNENDNLTCYYYLDGSATAVGSMTITGTKPEKIASFTSVINSINLTEGTHSVKATAKDSTSPMGETTITFKIDKSAPTISAVLVEPTTSSVKLTVTAADSIAGLSTIAAYRYTIGGVATDWITANYYNMNNLTANTNYSYKIEVRDNVGHIMESLGNFGTKVEKPVVTTTALSENKIQIVIKDNNPATTNYKIQVGSGYVNSSGVITANESWITVTYDASVGGKRLTLSNLSSNTVYSVIASAKNSAGTEIVASSSISTTTSPAAPANFAITAKSYNSIQLGWNTVAGAVNYELYRETVSSEGVVLSSKTIPNITSGSCSDSDIVSDQNYRYKIHSKNSAGIFGYWTEFLTVKTLPTPLAKVTDIASDVNESTLNITWNAILGAVGYEVEVTYDGTVWTDRYETNEAVLNTDTLNCQCSIRVRAFNVCNESDRTDKTQWSNGGAWSDSVNYYTEAKVPVVNTIASDLITPSSVKVQWSANDNPASVQYKLGVFKDNILEKEIACFYALESIVADLISETAYTFKVKAINSANVETEWSNEVSATTLMDYPSIPLKLRATAKSDIITLSWDIVEKAQSYQIEKNGIIIASECFGNTFKDEAVIPENEYSYKVKAINTTGESAWSQELVKKTLGDLPSSPTITAVSGSSISVTINWSPIDGVSGYDIEVDGHVYNVGLNIVYEHNGLIPGSYHSYRVRTRNIYGKSAWSEVSSLKTTPYVPATPDEVSLASADNQILIEWNESDGAVIYDIEIDGVIYQTNTLQYLFTVQGEVLPYSEHIIRVKAVNEGGESEWSSSYSIVMLPEGEGDIPEISIPATPIPSGNGSGTANIIISWAKCDDASIYQLEADNTIIYSGSNISFVHTALGENSQHQYRVRAGNITGYSEWSTLITVATGSSNTTTPENMTYYRESDNITVIMWDKVANVNEYRIEVNGVMSEVLVSDTKVNISTVPNEQYNIRIASVIHEGEDELLDWSEEVTFRAPSKLPKVPEAITITATSDTITVIWNEIIGAYGYEIEANGQIYNTSNTLTYKITNLEAASSQTIRVRAYNESGYSNWSESKTMMTNEGIPGVPINITGGPIAAISAATGSAIQIQWDAIEGVSSYEVEDANGQIYSTDTNKIVINNLIPGLKYDFRLRAITNGGEGAWSSKISFVPVITTPTNIAIVAEDGIVRLTWDKVGGAELYEIEVDGVTITTTNNTSIDCDYSTFYMQRSIRVRACTGSQKSEWSQEKLFEQSLPITLEVDENEVISILLPVENAEIGKYKLTLLYNTDELILVDACEITPIKEISSTYIDELNTHIMIEHNEDNASITFIIESDDNVIWSGIASSIQFKSNITGTVTLQYGVTLK